MAFARAAAKAMFPRLIKSGWSGRKIYTWLGSYGFQYHHSTFLSDVRRAKGLVDFGPEVVKLSSDTIVSRNKIVDSFLTQDRKYLITGQAKYTDINTGATRYRYISFYSDEQRSKQDWIDEYNDAHPENTTTTRPDNLVSVTSIMSVQHNIIMDW